MKNLIDNLIRCFVISKNETFEKESYCLMLLIKLILKQDEKSVWEQIASISFDRLKNSNDEVFSLRTKDIFEYNSDDYDKESWEINIVFCLKEQKMFLVESIDDFRWDKLRDEKQRQQLLNDKAVIDFLNEDRQELKKLVG